MAEDLKPCGMCMAKQRGRCCNDARRFDEQIVALRAELKKIDELFSESREENERLRAEVEEQARLLGMSGSREAALLAEVERLNLTLKAKRFAEIFSPNAPYEYDQNDAVVVSYDELYDLRDRERRYVEALEKVVKLLNQWRTTGANESETIHLIDEIDELLSPAPGSQEADHIPDVAEKVSPEAAKIISFFEDPAKPWNQTKDGAGEK